MTARMPMLARGAPCVSIGRLKYSAAKSQRFCTIPTVATGGSAQQPAGVEGWRAPLSGTTSHGVEMSAIAALGKFDALHRGHRALASRAASMGGQPWLITFSGMAEVLGWPQRLPLVAPVDREAVLQSWAPYCGGMVPRERCLPFAAVRSLSPQDFVQLLASDLRASGVVVGMNYRFGYRAAGTSATLSMLGQQYGMAVNVLQLVQADTASPSTRPGGGGGGGASDSDSNVSSSNVREALAGGNLAAVEAALGRPYQLTMIAPHGQIAEYGGDNTFRLPLDAFCNQPPGNGEYTAMASLFISDSNTSQGKEECILEQTIVQVQIDSSGCSISCPSLDTISFPTNRILRWSLMLRSC